MLVIYKLQATSKLSGNINIANMYSFDTSNFTSENITSTKLLTINNAVVNGLLSTEEVDVNGNLVVDKDVIVNGNLVVDKDVIFNSLLSTEEVDVNGVLRSNDVIVGGKILGNGKEQFLNFDQIVDSKIYKLERAMADAMGFKHLTTGATNFTDESLFSYLEKSVTIDPSGSRYSLFSDKLDCLTYYTATFLMAAEIINTIVAQPCKITIDPRQAELQTLSVTTFSINAGVGVNNNTRSMYLDIFKYQYKDTLNGDLRSIPFVPEFTKATYGLLNIEKSYDLGYTPISSLGSWVSARQNDFTHNFKFSARDFRIYKFPQGRYHNNEDGNTIYIYGCFWNPMVLILRAAPMFYPQLVTTWGTPGVNQANGKNWYGLDTLTNQFNGNRDYLEAYRDAVSKGTPNRPVWEYYHGKRDWDGTTLNLKNEDGLFDAYKIENWVALEIGRTFDESGNQTSYIGKKDHCVVNVIRTVKRYYEEIGPNNVGTQFKITDISIRTGENKVNYVNSLPITNWSTGPFKGYLVVCLAKVVASVLVGNYFAQLGATVIFIRDPQEITVTMFDAPLQCAGQVVYLNLRKDSSTGTADRVTFEALLSKANIFVTNLKESNFTKMGYSFNDLGSFAGTKGMVIAELSAFGEGDLKDSKGFADNVSQMNGLADLIQRYHLPAFKYPFAFYQDNIGGTTFFNGVLMAIRKMKMKKGGVFLVRSSLAESGAFVAANTTTINRQDSIKVYNNLGELKDIDMSTYGKYTTDVIKNCGMDLKKFNKDNTKVFLDWTVKRMSSAFNVTNNTTGDVSNNIDFSHYQANTTPDIHTNSIMDVAALKLVNKYKPYKGAAEISAEVTETLEKHAVKYSIPADGLTHKHNVITSDQAITLANNLF